MQTANPKGAIKVIESQLQVEQIKQNENIKVMNTKDREGKQTSSQTKRK